MACFSQDGVGTGNSPDRIRTESGENERAGKLDWLIGRYKSLDREYSKYCRMRRSTTNQRVFALHVFARKRFPVMVDKLKYSADLGPAHPFRRFCYPNPLHATLLPSKVQNQTYTRDEEECTGLQ